MGRTQSNSFQNILVGIDFSSYSQLVVKQAQKLAQEFNAELTLVYARTSWLIVENAKRFGLPEQAQFETAEMEKSARRYYKIPQDSKINVIVQRGLPDEILAKTAKHLANPLILIGTHGTGMIGRLILGSNAEKIAMSSRYPVWIQKGERVVSLQKILVPMDLTTSNIKTFGLVEKWFSEKKSKIESLFVRPLLPLGWEASGVQHFIQLEKEIEESRQRFEKTHPQTKLRVATGDPVLQINAVAAKYDVVVMSPDSKNNSAPFGRVTTKMIRLSPKPILIVKPGKPMQKVRSVSKQRFQDTGFEQMRI